MGSNLVDDLPAPLIKKLFHFYSDSERQIKLMEDENAGFLVCFFQAHVKSIFIVTKLTRIKFIIFVFIFCVVTKKIEALFLP